MGFGVWGLGFRVRKLGVSGLGFQVGWALSLLSFGSFEALGPKHWGHGPFFRGVRNRAYSTPLLESLSRTVSITLNPKP